MFTIPLLRDSFGREVVAHMHIHITLALSGPSRTLNALEESISCAAAYLSGLYPNASIEVLVPKPIHQVKPYVRRVPGTVCLLPGSPMRHRVRFCLLLYSVISVHIPAHREHPFWFNVNRPAQDEHFRWISGTILPLRLIRGCR